MKRSALALLLFCLAALAARGGAPDTSPVPSTDTPRPRLERSNPEKDPNKYRDVQDSQGNRYKVDAEGNIFTNGRPNPKRQPASADNIEYYFNYAVDLMSKGYTAQSLEVYREILALPPKNPRVAEAQKLVRANYDQVRNFNLKNQNLDINELVFVVRHIDDGRVTYQNEKFHFRLRYPVNWRMEEEVRHNKDEGYASFTLYPLPLPGPNSEKVTVAIGFRAENLPPNTTVERYREGWVKRLQEADRAEEKLNNLKRQSRPAGAERLRDHFEVRMAERHFEGDETFVVRGGIGYYITFTATPETYAVARDIFDRLLTDFEALP